MTNLLKPGKYVVAVSGGVDSVALLNMLSQHQSLNLIVAHFDHGIRGDSASDAEFVADLAAKYKLPFYAKREELGADASEALARERRYEFLHSIRNQAGALAIVTAHHQDDLIETALLNLVRGTKRRGLVSLKSVEMIQRPLLHMTKQDILDYAAQNKLSWREDSSNQELHYQRNSVRKIIKNSLTSEKRRAIIDSLEDISKQNSEIEQLLNEYLEDHSSAEKLDRQMLNSLYLAEAYEIAAQWLRKNNVSFDEQALKRLVIGSRTLNNGSQIDVMSGAFCLLSKTEIILKTR